MDYQTVSILLKQCDSVCCLGKGIWLELGLWDDSLSQGMHRVTLAGFFLLLLAALVFLWQHRFERSPEFPTYYLADLQPSMGPSSGVEWQGSAEQPKLRLRVDQDHPRVVTRLEFPNMKAVNFLHLRFQVAAKNLRPGKEIWEDGRCMIEWHSQAGESTWENDPFASVRQDQVGKITELVMTPEQGPATPVLRLENLGISGDFEIVALEASVLQERLLWKIGRWLLLVAWLAWAIAWIRSYGKGCSGRSFLAAAIWLSMGLHSVVPGPWKGIRALIVPFKIGEEVLFVPKPTDADVKTSISTPPVNTPAVLQSVGRIPHKGDFTLKVKLYLPDARPLLHIALLLGPTLLIACLVGRKSACSLAISLALATEFAETAFGFGFDAYDVFDLICDGFGIVLALFGFSFLKRIAPHRIAIWLSAGDA